MRVVLAFLVLAILAACQPSPYVPVLPPTALPTALPTFDASQSAATYCGDVDTAWGASDWPRVIHDLESIQSLGAQCGAGDPALKLYPAWYNYGAALEAKGDSADALNAYRRALVYNPQGQEAAVALKKRGAFTPEPLAVCSPQQTMGAQAAVPPYTPVETGSYVSVSGANLTLDGAPFSVHGVNYYPARAPWRHFLLDSTTDMLSHELDLIEGAGFNTIRVFVWYGALFICPGSGVVPNADAVARLDSVIQLAGRRGLHVLVTLNDLADLTFHPLYTEPELPAAQTAYIVARYRDEPAILAWDVRNEGDIDAIRGYAAAADIYDWLAHTTAQVRALDPHHLITAGWNEQSSATAGAVDFVSFHHWTTANALQDRAAALRRMTDKPILLEEVGYNTQVPGETLQAEYLSQALDAADASGLAGWIVWEAFDTTPGAACQPPDCPGADNAEYHFGLWRADGTPKQVVQVLQGRNRR